MLALTADRGLAGGVQRERDPALARRSRTSTAGPAATCTGWRSAARAARRCASAARRSTTSYTGITDRPKYADARAIAERVAELYIDGEVDLVVMVYNRFVSALTQQLETLEVLPVPEKALTRARSRS